MNDVITMKAQKSSDFFVSPLSTFSLLSFLSHSSLSDAWEEEELVLRESSP